MKLKHIDSIRGIAILMVMLVHVSHSVSGLSPIVFIIASYGQMGVQLFFVASAYTLCLSGTQRLNESFPVRKYAIRRFFRIAPTYYLGIVLYFLILFFQLNAIDGNWNGLEKYSAANVMSNVFFIHGFYEPANNNIVPGGWSIGTEMAFYALFPLLFSITRRYQNLSPFRALVLFCVTFLFAQAGTYLVSSMLDLTITNNSFLYFNLINQLPVFCAGILYFSLDSKEMFKFNWLISLSCFLLFSGLAVLLWLRSEPYLFSVIPTVSAVSFVFLLHLFKELDFLNLKLLQRIGTVSYSMYIVHFVFAYYLADTFLSWLPDSAGFLLRLASLYIMTLICSFMTALILERIWEKPFINLGKSIIKRMS